MIKVKFICTKCIFYLFLVIILVVKYMLYERLKKDFNNTSDLLSKKIDDLEIIYLESLCSSDKINEYILKTATLKKGLFLRDRICAPSVVYIDDYDKIEFYLLNGYALVIMDEEWVVCEVKAELFRSVSEPAAESAINGPKDSFNENILMNLGLIKRRIKSNTLVNKDYFIGRKTNMKTSILYLADVAKDDLVKDIEDKIKNIDIDGAVDIDALKQYLINKKSFLPTILKTERPDTVVTALLEGKVVILADNSPFALVLPAFLVDFINPQGDMYSNPLNVNLLKTIRFLCLIITITLPALYIAILNYSQETIPLKLLLSFQASRSGVPFPSSFEALFMIFLCSILRESDIRFPSTYGSSISILGALVLGEAAVSASVASPITIIIIGVTFIAGLVFSNGEMISGLRYLRIFLLVSAILFGLYGFVLGVLFILLYLVSINSADKPYMYPLAPFDQVYFFKSLLRKNKDKLRSSVLSNNRKKAK